MIGHEFAGSAEERIWRSAPEAYGVALDTIGEEKLGQYVRFSESVMYHGCGVGQLMYEMLDEAGLPPNIRNRGTFVGILHDVGKLDEEVLSLIDSERKLQLEELIWVRNRHCRLGAEKVIDLVGQCDETDLGFAWFASLHHHGLPSPEDTPPQLEEAWQMTALLQVADSLHALKYDERLYIDQLTDERIRELVLTGRVREALIEGVSVKVEPFVSRKLGLSVLGPNVENYTSGYI